MPAHGRLSGESLRRRLVRTKWQTRRPRLPRSRV